MRLTLEQIKAITVGSVRTEAHSDGIHFAKCTEKQEKAWLEKKEELYDRSRATTGVRLDFHTDSKTLAFKAISGSKYEIKIDGLTVAVYRPEAGDVISHKICDPLGHMGGEHRVTVVLPSHNAPAVIEYVELDDGSYVNPHIFDCKMLFIGDSITQGWASSLDSYSYAYRVSDFFNAESIIQGIGGAYYNEDSFDHIDFAPDFVFVSYGTNDFSHYKTYDEFKGHCHEHLSLIANEYKGKKIFVISPIWREHREGKAMGTFEGCRQIVIDEANSFGFIHVDGLTLVPPMPSLFHDEYLHPNDNGFSFYAENLIKTIKNIM
ncbi:MAG: SGNH/GDSL hydrolase family protein [Ruminococcaceae bacterium]|nr:SGNH/GDSL hydrolase family protein [Oscillospiraceae bacterium]